MFGLCRFFLWLFFVNGTAEGAQEATVSGVAMQMMISKVPLHNSAD
jgi:hypothetical protein